MSKEEYAEILLNTGAVVISPTEPFKYASGLLSPVYIYARRIPAYPRARHQVVEGLVHNAMEAVQKHKVSLVVGTGTSAISLATYVSQYLHLPMAYVRPASKKHGKGKQIEGIVKEGSKVLIVSDIFSTEDDTIRAIKALKEANCEVVFCSAIHTNNLGIIESFLEKENIPYATLTDLKTAVEVAYHKKLITKGEMELIQEWSKDPQAWDEKRRSAIQKRKENSEKRVSEILLEIKAVSLNVKDPFTYVSGIRSPIYTDNRLLISYPDEWKEIIDSCIGIIVDEIGLQNIDIIGGTATAGIPHAAYLAERLGLPMVYIKSVKNADGSKRFEVEGELPQNSRVLMMEDLISTGGSVIGSVKAVRKAGCRADHVIAIFTYQMEKGIEEFKKKHVEVFTLSNIDTLLNVATEKGYIQQAEKDAVVEWTRDTKGWGRKMGFE